MTATDLVIPGLASLARAERPDVPTTDDGNLWIDGMCWLYCQRWGRVTWIGPASVGGAVAAMFACAPCIRTLNDHVWDSILLADASPVSRPGTAEPSADRGSAGRHRGRSRWWGR